MSYLNFRSPEELQKIAESLSIKEKMDANFFITIRTLHFIHGIEYREMQDMLRLPKEEEFNDFFLNILGYDNWNDYHANRQKIKPLVKHSKEIRDIFPQFR